MRLEAMLLADAATATPDGKLYIHGGGITRITPPVLPWVQPQLAIVARFLLEEGDQEAEHELQLAVNDPNGEVIFPSATIAVPPLPRPTIAEGEETYVQVVLGIAPLMFAAEGIYPFDLRLDDRLVRSLPLAIVAVPLDQQGTAVTGTAQGE